MFATPMLGPAQIVVLLLVGVLLFGNRLPEVGKNLAKAIRDFKKGMSGIEDEIGLTSDTALAAPRTPQRISAPLPKFDGDGKA